MDGRCGTGQIVDFVHLHIEREGDIVPDQFEIWVAGKCLYVCMGTGEKIIDADDMSAGLNEFFAQVRAQESRTAGNKHALFEVHSNPVAECATLSVRPHGFNLASKCCTGVNQCFKARKMNFRPAERRRRQAMRDGGAREPRSSVSPSIAPRSPSPTLVRQKMEPTRRCAVRLSGGFPRRLGDERARSRANSRSK